MVMESIQNGYYSDPLGCMLYSTHGKDANGLTLYRCIQGTNSVEGGIYQNLIKRFSSYNVSPHFATNLLHDYCLCHNLKVHACFFFGPHAHDSCACTTCEGGHVQLNRKPLQGLVRCVAMEPLILATR